MVANARGFIRRTASYPVVLAAGVAITLSGCQTTGGNYSGGTGSYGSQSATMTPAQQEMRSSASAFNKTLWQGVAAGAIVGGLLGAVVGNSDNRAQNMLIGAGIGALAGGLAGNYLATKQQQYATSEAQLDAVIADLRQKNDEEQRLVASLETVVAEHRLEMAELDAKYKAGTVDESAYRRKVAQIEADREIVQDSITSANKQLDTFKETRTLIAQQKPQTDLSEMDAELAEMQANTDRLAALNDELRLDTIAPAPTPGRVPVDPGE